MSDLVHLPELELIYGSIENSDTDIDEALSFMGVCFDCLTEKLRSVSETEEEFASALRGFFFGYETARAINLNVVFSECSYGK